ncbi:unnamed protein product [Cyclocybe aegerita]|uniref:Secreted protein n=1 Tax=Cyclocybe aegerita TaxID=1973307 RepID=A0A8S0W655_CYCAE|nr:unnamed protein product [Cyclocybe aegerita]
MVQFTASILLTAIIIAPVLAVPLTIVGLSSEDATQGEHHALHSRALRVTHPQLTRGRTAPWSPVAPSPDIMVRAEEGIQSREPRGRVQSLAQVTSITHGTGRHIRRDLGYFATREPKGGRVQAAGQATYITHSPERLSCGGRLAAREPRGGRVQGAGQATYITHSPERLSRGGGRLAARRPEIHHFEGVGQAASLTHSEVVDTA